MPASDRKNERSASIYVERVYPGGTRRAAEEVATCRDDVVEKMQDWSYISNAKAVDPTWIGLAYTWTSPESNWKAQALRLLEEHSVHMAGRYARWAFRGPAEAIRDGLFTGGCSRGR